MASTDSLKKTVNFLFKVSPTEVAVYASSNLQIAGKYKVNYLKPEGLRGQVTCNCVSFKTGRNCHHATPLKVGCTKVLALLSERTVDPINVFDPEEKPFAHVYVVIQKKDDMDSWELKQISEDVGDLSAYALNMALLKNPSSADLTAHGAINPKALYEQFVVADHKRKNLADGIVLGVRSKYRIAEPTKETPVEPPKPVESGAAKIITWRDVKRPDPNEFYVDKDVWEQLAYSASKGSSVLLVGPSGAGKSEVVYQLAKAMDKRVEAFNMGAMSEPRTSLIGNTHFNKEKGTWFQESRFVRSIKDANVCILLDELSRARAEAYNILLPLLDRQRYLALDESEDAVKVERSDTVNFIATANIGMEYTGTEALDPALVRRFSVVEVYYPPKESEIRILMARTKIKMDVAKKLVNIAETQREMWKNQEFSISVSTAMLIEAAQQIADGFSIANALKFNVQNQFSSSGGDASERAQIAQIIQKEVGK